MIRIILPVMALLLSVCCTIRQQPAIVSIDSYQSDASIMIDGYEVGTTPQSFYLDPKHSHEVTLTKEGFKPETYVLELGISIKKLSSNLLFPLAGGVGGAGYGLVIGWCDAFGLGLTTSIGVCVGVGVVSLIVDGASGNARDLSHKCIEADLIVRPAGLTSSL